MTRLKTVSDSDRFDADSNPDPTKYIESVQNF